MCPQRKKSRHVRSSDLAYETVVEIEDLVDRITVIIGPVYTQYIVGPLIVVYVTRFLACPQCYQQQRKLGSPS